MKSFENIMPGIFLRHFGFLTQVIFCLFDLFHVIFKKIICVAVGGEDVFFLVVTLFLGNRVAVVYGGGL